MSKQTAVEWYINKLAEILGDKCNELTVEQTLANHYALKKAKAMEREQMIDSISFGMLKGLSVNKVIETDGDWVNNYLNETYGGENANA